MTVTSIDIDDELLHDARRLSGLKSKRDIIDTALREYVRRGKQIELADRIAGGLLTPTPDLLDPQVRAQARR